MVMRRLRLLAAAALLLLSSADGGSTHKEYVEISSSQRPHSHLKHKIILDTDPAGLTWAGLDVDDDLAILSLLAVESGCGSGLARGLDLEILGITTTAGNGAQRHTFADAEFLIASTKNSGRIPVFAGAGWYPPQLHTLHDLQRATDASNFIVDSVMRSAPQTITLICLGPLTNLATALITNAAVQDRLKQIVIMGGDLEPSHLDLNFVTDPRAANMVLTSRTPKILVPVQTCAQVAWTNEHHSNQCLASHNRKPLACKLLARMNFQTWAMPRFINSGLLPVEGFNRSLRLGEGFIPWDIVAVFSFTHPQLFSERMRLSNLRVSGYKMDWELVTDSSFQDNDVPNEVGQAEMFKRVKEQDLLATASELIFKCQATEDKLLLPIPVILHVGLLPEIVGMVLALCLVVALAARVARGVLNASIPSRSGQISTRPDTGKSKAT